MARPAPVGWLTGLTGERRGRGTERLRVPPQRCPVVVLAKSLETREPITFDWQRPLRETARSTGGPLIRCKPARRS